MGEVSHEPSMGEILSSIKRIIAEDADAHLSSQRGARRAVAPVTDTTPPPASRPEPVPEPQQGGEVLELTAAEAVSDEQETPMARDDTALPRPATIVSPNTVAATRSSIAALSALVVKPDIAGSDTLEGMVRDMLKPMLADWLDARLPAIVERLVAQEIKRIAAEG